MVVEEMGVRRVIRKEWVEGGRSSNWNLNLRKWRKNWGGGVSKTGGRPNKSGFTFFNDLIFLCVQDIRVLC